MFNAPILKAPKHPGFGTETCLKGPRPQKFYADLTWRTGRSWQVCWWPFWVGEKVSLLNGENVTSNDRGWKGPGLNHLVGIVLLQPKPFHFWNNSEETCRCSAVWPRKIIEHIFCCPPKIGKQLLAIVNKHNKKSRGRKRWHRLEISFIDGVNFHLAFSKLQTFPKLSQASRNAKMGCFFFPTQKSSSSQHTHLGQCVVQKLPVLHRAIYNGILFLKEWSWKIWNGRGCEQLLSPSKNCPFFSPVWLGKENSTKQGKDENMSSSHPWRSYRPIVADWQHQQMMPGTRNNHFFDGCLVKQPCFM